MIATRIGHAQHSESDENRDLQRRVQNCLRLRLQDFSSIEVETQNGTAILRGVVPSQSIKWRCGECCRYVAGVLNVIDRLVVKASHGVPARAEVPTHQFPPESTSLQKATFA